MSKFYDDLEHRGCSEREAALMAALPAQVRHAKTEARAFGHTLKSVNPDEITSREALARLPILRKSSLSEQQKDDPPFGGVSAVGLSDTARVFASPGPIFEPESHRKDYWRLARALYAGGFRRGELIHNTFSYHFSPAGSMLETGAHALGCAVFPAGVGQTELQVQAIAHLRPSGFVGTPSFLKIILDKGRELGADLSSLTKAVVSGEALPPSLREELAAHGVQVVQCYAIADLGLVAYESEAREGLILDEGVLVEIVRPGTGDPVPDGEVGEVVVTTFNPDYPLVRFATGDLSAVLEGLSPCGRTNYRLKGWMGRADQTTKVRGMFVQPAMIHQVIKRYPEIRKARLVVGSVDNQDTMTLHCEAQIVSAPASEQPNEQLIGALADTMREVCKLRAEVRLEPLGALANDGKVIDDQRTYE